MYPSGLFIDTSDSNTLYVADKNNHRIQMWLSGGTSGTTVAGITNYYGIGFNQLWYPQAVIVVNNRNMYIVDSWNSRIMKWMIGASSGVVIGDAINFDTQSIQIQYPKNIDFDSNGSLFVTDALSNRIQKFVISCLGSTNVSTTTVPSMITTLNNSNTSCPMTTWYSNATTIAGSSIGENGSTPTTLFIPYDVFIDKNDTIYVLDSLNLRVQRFQPPSIIGTTVVNVSYYAIESNQFPYLTSISVDVTGNIYLLESNNNRVMKWKPGVRDGVIVAGGNGNGASARQLNNPYGMFIDSKLIIWIADTYNHRIVRWENASTGIVVCGSYGTGANQFDHPSGIFIDTNDGNTFYVADTMNHRIQMWIQGAINGITVVGQTGVCGSRLNLLCGPSSVIRDINGNLYITDTYSSRIVLWMKGSNSVVSIAGNSGMGVLPNQLFNPSNMKLDSNGALIVADSRNNRIEKFSVFCYGRTTSGGMTSVSFNECSKLLLIISFLIIFIFQL